MLSRILCVLAMISGMLAAIACSHGPGVVIVNGAGSTFGYPIYSTWFDAYSRVQPRFRFNYQAIGSGGGIKQLLNQTVDFGATDAPMTDEQIRKAPEKILHFPTVMGGVAVIFNLPGLNGSLKLTGPLLAEIYLGKIKSWNDPALTANNPGLNLPDREILACFRSDGSGDTYIITDYLSKVSAQWKTEVGNDTAVRWPTGIGGKGNDGVTALIKESPNSIGYVTLTYALINQLPTALIRNRAGRWVKPTSESVTAAAASLAAAIPPDFRMSLTDAPGVESYPLSSLTYLLVYAHPGDQKKGEALVGLLHWMLTDGQKYAAPMAYASLPGVVAQKAEKQINLIVLPSR